MPEMAFWHQDACAVRIKLTTNWGLKTGCPPLLESLCVLKYKQFIVSGLLKKCPRAGGRGEGGGNKAQISPPHQTKWPPLLPEDGRFDPTSCTSFDSS